MKILVQKRPDKVCDFIEQWIQKEGKEIEKAQQEHLKSKMDDSHLPSSVDSFDDAEEERDEFDEKKVSEK